jgi:hypothetical protein
LFITSLQQTIKLPETCNIRDLPNKFVPQFDLVRYGNFCQPIIKGASEHEIRFALVLLDSDDQRAEVLIMPLNNLIKKQEKSSTHPMKAR